MYVSAVTRDPSGLPDKELARRVRAGEEIPAPAIDLDRVAQLVVFATDALKDAETILGLATKLQGQAMVLYHEADDLHGDEKSRAGWRAYQEQLAAWHESQLAAIRKQTGES